MTNKSSVAFFIFVQYIINITGQVPAIFDVIAETTSEGSDV